jgi:hypothetical protein
VLFLYKWNTGPLHPFEEPESRERKQPETSSLTGIYTNLRIMSSIKAIIETCTAALAAVTPENLTPAQLDSSLDALRSIQINEVIDEVWESLPEKPDNDEDVPAWENENHSRATTLNHDLKLFNDQLSRVKTMQTALKIPQLDTLIRAAQEVIRPLYNFSAQLSG